jgi:hypothetical protein
MSYISIVAAFSTHYVAKNYIDPKYKIYLGVVLLCLYALKTINSCIKLLSQNSLDVINKAVVNEVIVNEFVKKILMNYKPIVMFFTILQIVMNIFVFHVYPNFGISNLVYSLFN